MIGTHLRSLTLDMLQLNHHNKLTPKHINYERHKMKVYLAAQTLSESVAVAFDLATELKIPEFQETKTTVLVCRINNELFDNFCFHSTNALSPSLSWDP